jgi:hypothetical protein
MAGVNVRFGAAGTVPSRNQLSNVLIFFSQSGSAPASRLRALPMRFSSLAAQAAKRASELPNPFPKKNMGSASTSSY